MAIYQDDKLVKRAYKKVSYTKEQIDELKACWDPKAGPTFFIQNYMYIQHTIRGREKLSLYNFQYDLINNYHNYRRSVNMVSRQMGKALSIETPILTPDGFISLGDLSIGDTIYGQDGKKTKITFITETMNDRPCYEIQFMHGEKIIADAEHLWNVTDPHRGNITITTLELLERFGKFNTGSQSLHIKHNDVIEFTKKELPVNPYIFGVWLGDGGTSDGRITCTIDDFKVYKEKFESIGYKVSDFRLDKRSERTGNFTTYGLVTDLKKTGAWGNKHIPHNYIFNSVENRLELLRGLMDTDGTCEKSGVSRFYQSNRKLADEVRLLLSTLGIKSTIKGRETKFKENFSVVFATNKFDIFLLPRKLERQKRLKNHPKNTRIYIRSIRLVQSVPVRCLQVDNENHLFLCGKTLIPTHNTTVAAGYLLWYAMFNKDSTILIASNKYDGAQEIMHRVRYAYESVPDHIRAGVKSYNKRSIDFDNGSRIIATTTTENTGRGMSLSLVYLDEFAFVEPSIAKEFWTSLSPTLSTGGKCIITSTPNTDEDQFADIWWGGNKMVDANGNETEIGVNGFKPYMATWGSHPERDQEWADAELAALGEDRFLREHMCQFITFEETLINPVKLTQLETKIPIRKSGQVRWYSDIHSELTYVVSLDPSMGTGGDNSAIQILELPTLVQVAEWSNNKTAIEEQVRTLKKILEELYSGGARDIYWSVESNSLGEAALVVIRDTGEENFHGTMLHDPKNRLQGRTGRKAGFITTNKSKLEACAKLKFLIESGKMKINSKGLLSELKVFVSRGNTFEARIGQTDDLIMAMILAIRMTDFISTWDDKSQAAINSNIGSSDDLSYDAPLPIFI